MLELHCQRCGGLSRNPAAMTGPEASTATPPVPLHVGRCVCGEPPSLWELQGGGVHRIRSASRN
jgi:hypothetical protein